MPTDRDRTKGNIWLARLAGWIRDRVSWHVSAKERGRLALGMVARRDQIERIS